MFGDGFKYKWLEYFVDVLRVINIYIRVMKTQLDENFKVMLATEAIEILPQYKILTK